MLSENPAVCLQYQLYVTGCTLITSQTLARSGSSRPRMRPRELHTWCTGCVPFSAARTVPRDVPDRANARSTVPHPLRRSNGQRPAGTRALHSTWRMHCAPHALRLSRARLRHGQRSSSHASIDSSIPLSILINVRHLQAQSEEMAVSADTGKLKVRVPVDECWERQGAAASQAASASQPSSISQQPACA